MPEPKSNCSWFTVQDLTINSHLFFLDVLKKIWSSDFQNRFKWQYPQLYICLPMIDTVTLVLLLFNAIKIKCNCLNCILAPSSCPLGLVGQRPALAY